MSDPLDELAELALELLRDDAHAPAGHEVGRARARLLEITAGPQRYAPFIDRVARFFCLDAEVAERLLSKIQEPTAWRAGFVPSSSMVPVRPGPGFVGAAMFVRFDPGTHCPMHRHVGGDERVLVLEGGFVEADGTELHPGDEVVKTSGSAHAFRVFDDDRCIAAYALEGGLELVV